MLQPICHPRSLQPPPLAKPASFSKQLQIANRWVPPAECGNSDFCPCWAKGPANIQVLLGCFCYKEKWMRGFRYFFGPLYALLLSRSFGFWDLIHTDSSLQPITLLMPAFATSPRETPRVPTAYFHVKQKCD